MIKRRLFQVVVALTLLFTLTLSSTGVANAAGRSGVDVKETWYGMKVTVYLNSDACAEVAAVLAAGAGVGGLAEVLAKYFSWNLPGIVVNLLMPVLRYLLALNAGVLAYGARHNGMYAELLVIGKPIPQFVTPGVAWYQ